MAGVERGIVLGGGRSSGEVGNGAVGHGGANGWVLRPPGDVLSTVRHSVAALSDSGHGGDMAGGAELSGSMGTAAREGNRGQGERGSVRRLTERITKGSAGAGTAGGQRIDGEDLRAPRLKNTLGTVLCHLPCFFGAEAHREDNGGVGRRGDGRSAANRH